jgi:hypothetical protein
MSVQNGGILEALQKDIDEQQLDKAYVGIPAQPAKGTL